MLLSLLAFPLVMNSYWALLPVAVGVAVLIVRTMLEDRFLVEQLPGYKDYTSRTRWKLLPGLL
jgi:protein-S-isoprenylcysteine O-methyltransferase Ste14